MYNDLSNNLNDINNINDITFLIFKKIGINISNINDLIGKIIYRDIFLNESIYNDIKEYIPRLKTVLKTTYFTSTQKNATLKQNWPLLNLIRQILKLHSLSLEPKRIADGYTKDHKKKYKRLFEIKIIDKNTVII